MAGVTASVLMTGRARLWYCNQCGAGDGLKLVEKVFGVSPSDAATKVAAVTGSLPRLTRQ